MAAVRYVETGEQILSSIAGDFKAKREEIQTRITNLNKQNQELEKQIEHLNQKLAHHQAKTLLANVQKIGTVNLLVEMVSDVDGKVIRTLIDSLKSHFDDSVIVLVGKNGDDLALAASISKTLQDKIKAGDIIRTLANELGGKGGGKADYAQGGAKNGEQLNTILANLHQDLTARLAQ